ncbi:phosphonate C-P lyase system protein PhnH [Nocardia sp. BMG51109]|uniref:phosphonate C-P lyase system protein PhnH n=1 Tax=Nocardia sp. BMG51109 TaxID=1056816 RepID=UPI000463DB5A|nr:phosphonate C-P lyase system protein PhnH [Nocardia sp. BMG51109]
MTGVVLDRIAAATLRPDESRQVFRAVLDALSRPGRIEQLPAERLPATPAALLPVLALADLGTGVAVLDDGAAWAEVIGVVTSAPEAPLGTARFVAATRTPSPGELREACRGRALAPEEGALVCFPVPDLDSTDLGGTAPGGTGVGSAGIAGVGGTALAGEKVGVTGVGGTNAVGAEWILSGPGVPGRRALSGPDGALVAARAEAVAGFPAGIDLLLITPDGRMAGIPRTTVIEGKDL